MRLQRDIAYKIVEFIGDGAANNVNSLYNQFKMVIIETYDKRNWKGLRMIFGDIIEMTGSLSSTEYKELNAILFKEFGKTKY